MSNVMMISLQEQEWHRPIIADNNDQPIVSDNNTDRPIAGDNDINT